MITLDEVEVLELLIVEGKAQRSSINTATLNSLIKKDQVY